MARMLQLCNCTQTGKKTKIEEKKYINYFDEYYLKNIQHLEFWCIATRSIQKFILIY